MGKNDLSAETARYYLRYDEGTGNLYWRRQPSRSVMPGQVAGSKSKDGYISLSFAGHTYLAHRLIWLIKTGNWPEFEIDHINRDRSDNRWSNLRDVNRTVNQRNTMGGGYFLNRGKFLAMVGVGPKSINLGRYETEQEARFAYEVAKRELAEAGDKELDAKHLRAAIKFATLIG